MKDLILGVIALAMITASVNAQTQSEMDDAAAACGDLIKTIGAFRSNEHWADDVDRLERDARRYVGKSKVQIVMLDREFPDAPADVKKNVVVMLKKLDEAAAAAICFTQAWHKGMASGTYEDLEAAETVRQKFIKATKEWALAAQAVAGT
jgi:hypothetical protein